MTWVEISNTRVMTSRLTDESKWSSNGGQNGVFSVWGHTDQLIFSPSLKHKHLPVFASAWTLDRSHSNTQSTVTASKQSFAPFFLVVMERPLTNRSFINCIMFFSTVNIPACIFVCKNVVSRVALLCVWGSLWLEILYLGSSSPLYCKESKAMLGYAKTLMKLQSKSWLINFS